MTSLNKAYFIGHLGRTPERRTGPSGATVVRISLATKRLARVDDTTVETTEWHRLTANGPTAEHLATRQKGDTLAVECTIRPNRWTDSEGHEHHDVTFVIERVLWCTTPTKAAKLPLVAE